MKWRSLQESSLEPGARRLYEIYAERRELIAKYVPAEIQAVHARVVDELKHSGIAERALQSGDAAPQFELSDQNAKTIRSADLLKTGPVLICFIRGRWCPFCVGQLEAMNAIVPALEQLGASLVGVSPQTVHQSFLMADQHRLQFPLLSDAGNRVARQFGLVYRVPDYQQEIYRRAFVNLPFVNGDDRWELPIPATYILKPANSGISDTGGNKMTDPGSTSGTLQQSSTHGATAIYASPNPDYTVRPEPADLLHRISQLV